MIIATITIRQRHGDASCSEKISECATLSRREQMMRELRVAVLE